MYLWRLRELNLVAITYLGFIAFSYQYRNILIKNTININLEGVKNYFELFV